MALRAKIDFSSELPTGVDAAYYPLQARALLEHGKLAYYDLPLVFALDAALAKVLMAVRGMNVDAATLLASRFLDTVAEPMAAIPIFALGLVWAEGNSRSLRLALGLGAAAMVATASWPIVRMTGDFQKNSVGLVWFALAAWAAHAALASGGWKRWAFLAMTVVLAALTHVAALGATMVLVGGTLVTYAVLAGRASIRRLAAITAGAMAVGAVVVLCVHLASPARARALLAAPITLLRGSRMPLSAVSAVGPVGMLLLANGWLIAAWALWRTWRERKRLAPAPIAVVVGVSVTLLSLTCPLLSGDYFARLSLMGPLPAALALAFILARRAREIRAVWPGFVVAAVFVAPVVAGFRNPPPAMTQIIMRVIPDDSAEEFRSLRPLVSNPVHTVVVARHGLEWWAGYFMHTPVRDRDGISDSLFDRYDRVLLLVETGDHSGLVSTALLPDGSALIHDGRYFRLFDIKDDRAADPPAPPPRTK